MVNNRILIKYILILNIFVFISSCVRDDDNLFTLVDYPKIVGNYTGTGKFCTIIEAPSDTICDVEQTNNLKIVIPGLNTIRISDSNGLLDSIHLNYIQKSVTETGIHYDFAGEVNSISYKLIYHYNENSIQLITNPLTDNPKHYTYSAIKSK